MQATPFDAAKQASANGMSIDAEWQPPVLAPSIDDQLSALIAHKSLRTAIRLVNALGSEVKRVGKHLLSISYMKSTDNVATATLAELLVGLPGYQKNSNLTVTFFKLAILIPLVVPTSRLPSLLIDRLVRDRVPAERVYKFLNRIWTLTSTHIGFIGAWLHRTTYRLYFSLASYGFVSLDASQFDEFYGMVRLAAQTGRLHRRFVTSMPYEIRERLYGRWPPHELESIVCYADMHVQYRPDVDDSTHSLVSAELNPPALLWHRPLGNLVPRNTWLRMQWARVVTQALVLADLGLSVYPIVWITEFLVASDGDNGPTLYQRVALVERCFRACCRKRERLANEQQSRKHASQ